MSWSPRAREQATYASFAILAAIVLSTRVYVEFPRIRIQAAASVPASAEGRVTVPLPDVPAIRGEPMSLVLLLRNEASEPRTLFVSVDGREVARVLARPERTTRADLIVPPDRAGVPGAQLAIQSTHQTWSLHLAEVGNAYGFSSGVFSLVIAPSGTTRYAGVPPWLSALAGVALFVMARRLSRPVESQLVRVAHRVVGTLFVVVLVATLVLPAVSVYAVLLSVKAFVLAVLLVHFPAVNALFWRVQPTLTAGLVATGRFVVRNRYGLLAGAAVALFLSSIASFHDARTGFTSFVGFGEMFDHRALPTLRAVPHHVDPSPGYDGQFYAQLALDPLVRDPAIEVALDNLPYRGRRILFAWTAWALGLGQPEWIVHAYAMQNMLCWLVLAILLFRWLPPTSLVNFVAWFACLFTYGLMATVKLALLEGPSLLMVALAVLAVERSRPWLSTGLLAFAALGRETNILGGAALVDRPPRPRAIVRLAAQGLLMVLPLLLWVWYLRLSYDMGETLGSSGNFASPLSGLIEEYRGALVALGRDGWWEGFARFDLMSALGVTVQSAFLIATAVRHWRQPWLRVGLAYAVLMMFLGTAVWEASPGAYARVLLPMVWAFNILLARERPWLFWPLVILGNLNVLNGLEALRVPYIWTYL